MSDKISMYGGEGNGTFVDVVGSDEHAEAMDTALRNWKAAQAAWKYAKSMKRHELAGCYYGVAEMWHAIYSTLSEGGAEE